MVTGFIHKFLQKDKDTEFRDQVKGQFESRKKEPTTEKKTGRFDKFVESAEVQKRIKEWMTKWKYKKRGVMALLYILWLQGGSEKKVLKTAKDILSKLKGEDIFAKFLNALKLAPEKRMK